MKLPKFCESAVKFHDVCVFEECLHHLKHNCGGKRQHYKWYMNTRDVTQSQHLHLNLFSISGHGVNQEAFFLYTQSGQKYMDISTLHTYGSSQNCSTKYNRMSCSSPTMPPCTKLAP